MLPMFLMKDRRFVLVSVQTLVLFAGFQSAMYFLSFLYIQSFGYTALQAGAASLPISIIVFFISSRAARLASTHGPRIILCSSSILMAISLFWLSFADGDYFYSVMPGMVVMGFSGWPVCRPFNRCSHGGGRAAWAGWSGQRGK